MYQRNTIFQRNHIKNGVEELKLEKAISRLLLIVRIMDHGAKKVKLISTFGLSYVQTGILVI